MRRKMTFETTKEIDVGISSSDENDELSNIFSLG